ncbi:hypothetical protein [Eggerthella sp. YY7918]|uniref:hypothetical protein n=1 Tax=Eggerthella sp. (strain YY7918) TaxID=502558 RepID=UPI00021716CE|nr:hypothetical protein [Eggerthella sp. YY7918]BAK45565.1 hypothetical protein EGYY_24960 [Eggerthella sp. YY7918]
MTIFGNKMKDGRIVANFSTVSVPGIDAGWAVEAILGDRELVIRPRVTKTPEVVVGYDRILGCTLGTEEQIIEKQKSFYGRAILGSLIFGPAGAVVGGLDGLTKKRKKSMHTYLSIEYGSIMDPKAVVLEVVGATLGLSKWLEEFEDHAPWIVDESPKAPEPPKRIEL